MGETPTLRWKDIVAGTQPLAVPGEVRYRDIERGSAMDAVTRIPFAGDGIAWDGARMQDSGRSLSAAQPGPAHGKHSLLFTSLIDEPRSDHLALHSAEQGRRVDMTGLTLPGYPSFRYPEGDPSVSTRRAP